MIHCYTLGGMNIVLDVCSGSVHVVDDVAFEIIQNYETTPKEELSARIRVLIRRHGVERVDKAMTVGPLPWIQTRRQLFVTAKRFLLPPRSMLSWNT